MKPFKQLIYISAIVILGSQVLAGPVEAPSAVVVNEAEEASNREIKQNEEIVKTTATTASPKPKPDKDLDVSNSNQQTTYVVSFL